VRVTLPAVSEVIPYAGKQFTCLILAFEASWIYYNTGTSALGWTAFFMNIFPVMRPPPITWKIMT